MKSDRNKISIKTELKITDISKLRLYLGIFLFIFSALSIYLIMYIIRETFWVLSVTEDGDRWNLTNNQLHFNNVFFAFISSILAQSITINFWLNRPKKVFRKNNRKRKTIINDNRILNWYFINWFAKLAVLYAIMFGLAFRKGYYVFSFYPDYNYVFILIIIVLFLQTWTTIRITIKNSLKYMIISGGIISIFAFGLSNVHPVNHTKLNDGFIKDCVICRYDLQLPQSGNFERLYNRSLIENIYIVLNSDNQIDIVINNEIVELDKFSDKIKWFQSQKDISEIPLMIFRLHIDKRIKMDFINIIKTELSNCNVTRIAYAVIPIELEYDVKYYQNLSVSSYIHRGYRAEIIQDNVMLPQPSFDLKTEIDEHEIMFVEYLNTNDFKCNDTIISKTNFESYISSFILANTNYLITIQIKDNDSFENYFYVLSKCKNVINQLRDDYSFYRFNQSFEDLDYEKQYEVKNKYPISIIELTTKMNKELKIFYE